MNGAPKPDWTLWRNIPRLSDEEAVALTLNLDPAKIRQSITDDWDTDLSDFSKWSREIPADLVPVLEQRLFMFGRIHGSSTMISPGELLKLAQQLNWDIPNELANLALPASAEAEPIGPSKATDNERTKLLKHIGGLALLLAEKAKVYAKGKGQPNASQIAQGVVEYISDLPGRAGAGRSSLRDSIKEGIDLLKR